MPRALAPAALLMALAPALAPAQAPTTSPTAPGAVPTVPALAAPELAGATVERVGARMVLRAEYRLPAPAAGRVPVRWRAFGGPRRARALAVVARGATTGAVTGTTMRVVARAPMVGGLDRSGGFCLAPDWAAVGLVGPAPACMVGARVARARMTAHVPEVTVIADSVGTGLDYIAGGRAGATGRWSAVFDLKVCRRLVALPCPPNPPSALSVIRALGPAVGDIAVIHVGYNDSGAQYDIARVMSALRARGVRRVVWVNLQGIAPFAKGVNAAISRAAGRYGWLQVGDWNARSAGRAWFTADRDHVTPSGARALAAFYREEIARALRALRDQPGASPR